MREFPPKSGYNAHTKGVLRATFVSKKMNIQVQRDVPHRYNENLADLLLHDRGHQGGLVADAVATGQLHPKLPKRLIESDQNTFSGSVDADGPFRF